MRCYRSRPLPMPAPSTCATARTITAQVLLSVGGLVGQEVDLDELPPDAGGPRRRARCRRTAARSTCWIRRAASCSRRAAHLPELTQIRLKVGQGMAGHVAQTGERGQRAGSRAASAASSRTSTSSPATSTESLLAVPLRGRDGRRLRRAAGAQPPRRRRASPKRTAQRLAGARGQVAHGAAERPASTPELERAREQPQAPVGYFFNRIIGESRADAGDLPAGAEGGARPTRRC